jgi:glycosyltransferase involved in cell wall biosynthesis
VRALVISPQPFFSPRGTPFSVYYRTLVTAELGVQVDLLTYGQGQDVELPGLRIYRIPRFARLGPVPIGPSLLKLWLDLFLVLWTVALLARRRYDFVHAHEESVFFALLLKPLFRFRLLYDMHSSLPQQLTNFSFTRSRLAIGLFEKLEDACLAHADAVITVCPALRDHALPRMPDPKRHFLIENSLFDPVRVRGGAAEAVAPNPAPELPEGRPIVAYAGTFESYQGIDLLLRAFAVVCERRPDACLLLIGGTPAQVAERRALASELGIGDAVRFTGTVPRDVAGACQARATVLVSPRLHGTNTPLKVYEQIASGVPLVATRIVSHTQVLSPDMVFLVEPEREALAAGILSALGDPVRAARVAERARQVYEQRYSRASYEESMRQVLAVLA